MNTNASPRMGEATPARLFTVTSTLHNSGGTFARFADACRSLAALRHNQPHFTHSLLDPDGYIVPSTEILKGLAIVRNEAETALGYVQTYEAAIAPAYETTPDMPAQDIAEQAIKEARQLHPELPAFTCYTTTIVQAGVGPLTWVRGEVGTTATVQPKMLAFLRQCKKEGSRWDDSRDFSEPTPEGATELCLWLMWGTAIHLQRRIFIRPMEGPADEAAPVGEGPAAAAEQAPRLEPWQRAALIDMAGGPTDTPADVLVLIAGLSDEQLVQAAGFAPMLPALLNTWLPVLQPDAE